jgi:ribosomal protein S18 acetylase RimI-like enzyme
MESGLLTRSDSYPPGKEVPVSSQSHKWVLNNLSKIQTDLKIYYRPVERAELEEVKSLHSEWFPINYSDKFFDTINTNTISIAAVLHPSDYGNKELRDVIVGIILFRVTPASDHSYFRFTYLFKTVYTAYIATLGVIQPLRRYGIASDLISRCLEYCHSIETRPQLLYLHVAEYNQSGIAFYERNDFKLLDIEADYYFIQGVRYSGIIYGIYINGGKGPIFTRDNLYSLFHRIIKIPTYLKPNLFHS